MNLRQPHGAIKSLFAAPFYPLPPGLGKCGAMRSLRKAGGEPKAYPQGYLDRRLWRPSVFSH